MINTVFIELTNRCNCRCKSCPQSVGLSRPKGYMNFDLFKRVVDEAWTISSTINLSFFGEPSLHPEFLQCLRYLQRRPMGKTIIIFSNFLNVTQEMMNEIINTTPRRVHLSINASTSQTYDAIRCGQSCVDLNGETHFSNRFDILRDKVIHWFKLPNRPITRHEFTVASYSVHELKTFVEMWLPRLRMGDEILTKSILSYGGIMLNEPFLTSAPCGMWGAPAYLVVDWQGNVSPCFLDNGMRLIIGSVTQNSLRSIQEGQKRKNIRQQSLARTIKPCDTCLDASHNLKTRIYTKGSLWSDKHLGDWQ